MGHRSKHKAVWTVFLQRHVWRAVGKRRTAGTLKRPLEPGHEKRRRRRAGAVAAKLQPAELLGTQCIIAMFPSRLARWEVSRCFFLFLDLTLVRAWSSSSCHHPHSGCPESPPSGWGKFYKCPRLLDLDVSIWGGLEEAWTVTGHEWVPLQTECFISDL